MQLTRFYPHLASGLGLWHEAAILDFHWTCAEHKTTDLEFSNAAKGAEKCLRREALLHDGSGF